VANSETFNLTTPSDREIVMTRLFDAPRRLVFDAMTKPEVGDAGVPKVHMQRPCTTRAPWFTNGAPCYRGPIEIC